MADNAHNFEKPEHSEQIEAPRWKKKFYQSPGFYLLLILAGVLIGLQIFFSLRSIGLLPPNTDPTSDLFQQWAETHKKMAEWAEILLWHESEHDHNAIPLEVFVELGHISNMVVYVSLSGIGFYVLAVVCAVLGHKDPIRPNKKFTRASGWLLAIGIILCVGSKIYKAVILLLFNDNMSLIQQTHAEGENYYYPEEFLQYAVPIFTGLIVAVASAAIWGAYILGMPKYIGSHSENYGPSLEMFERRKELELEKYGEDFAVYYKRPSFYITFAMSLAIPFALLVFLLYTQVNLDTLSTLLADYIVNVGPLTDNFAHETYDSYSAYFGTLHDFSFVLMKTSFAVPIFFGCALLVDVGRTLRDAKKIDHTGERYPGILKSLKKLFVILGVVIGLGTSIFYIVVLAMRCPVDTTFSYLLSQGITYCALMIVMCLAFVIAENACFGIVYTYLPFPMEHLLDEEKQRIIEEEEAYVEEDDSASAITDLDPLMENVSISGSIEEQDLLSPLQLKDLWVSHATSSGLRIDEKNSVRLFSAMEASRLIFVKGLINGESKKLLNSLAEFYGGRYYLFDEIPTANDLLDLNQDIASASEGNIVFVGIDKARSNLFDGELKDVLPTLYDSSKSYRIPEREDGYKGPSNLYTFVFLKEGDEGFDLDKEALTYGALIHLLVNNCQPQPENMHPFPMHWEDWIALGNKCADENYLSEENWKKIDALVNFGRSKTGFKLPNDVRNGIERSVGFYMAAAYLEEEAMDASIASILLPSLIKDFMGNLDELEAQVTLIFGESGLNKIKDVFENAAKVPLPEVEEAPSEETVYYNEPQDEFQEEYPEDGNLDSPIQGAPIPDYQQIDIPEQSNGEYEPEGGEQ